MGVKEIFLLSNQSHETIGSSPIAVIVELVIAGVRHVSTEASTDGEEDLDCCIDPHLQRLTVSVSDTLALLLSSSVLDTTDILLSSVSDILL